MRVILFGSYYDKYLEDLYKKRPALALNSFDDQISVLISDYFGVFGSYTKHAKKLDVDAFLIPSNCKPLQKMWAKENGVKWDEKNWKFSIPIEQVKKIRPDVFFMSSMFEYYGPFIDEVKKYVPKVFGWIACPIPGNVNLKQMDLILTSLPKFVDEFRKQNIASEFLPAAFDPDILNEFPTDIKRDIQFSFVGSYTKSHLRRIELVGTLLDQTPLQLFGTGIKLLPDKRNAFQRFFSDGLAVQRYGGEVWGLNMYKTLRRSKITFNSHIDMSGNFAGNMRMYEATGMGALLLTDGKKDIRVFSEEEVVYYESAEDAIEKVFYYLTNSDKRDAIAKRGQQATLKKYNFESNTIRMLDYFKKYS